MSDTLSPLGRALLVLAAKYGGPIGQGRSAIARWAGVHRSHLYLGCRQYGSRVSRETVERIADALGIHPDLVWAAVRAEEKQ